MKVLVFNKKRYEIPDTWVKELEVYFKWIGKHALTDKEDKECRKNLKKKVTKKKK